MTRNRFAAALFAVGALTFLWFALGRMCCGSGCAVGSVLGSAPALGLAALHGALALGVLADRPWARWMGIGVGFAWVFSTALMACSASPIIWLFAALHAPLPLLLARQDGIHGRTSVSLLLAGMALPLALSVGLAELARLEMSWANLLATGFVAVGAMGLARERTWGLLLVGLSGLTFFLGGLVDPVAMERQWFEITGLVALPLLAALIPFLQPMVSFLASRDET